MASASACGNRRRVSPRRQSRWARIAPPIALSLGWLALSAVLSTTAAAQRFRADPVDEQARRLSGFATNWIRDPARYAAEKDRFAEYFTKAYFPSMTQFGPDDLAQLGDLRYKLFSDFLRKTSNETLQHDLTTLAYDYMTKVVQGANYHPAVRYNAMLTLGMLDEVYVDDRANRPLKPLADANTYLVKAVNAAAQATTQEKVVPAYLVVGALIGLERHARAHESLDPERLEAMTAAVVNLLSNDPPLTDLDRDVSEWIKLRAASVLAKLGSPGAKGEVHHKLLDLLAGQNGRKMTLDARCQLVALLASINYEGASVDAKATADQIFPLALDVAQAETKRAKEFEELHLAGGSFGGGYEGRSRQYSSYGQPLEYDRRLLLARLSDLGSGLRAVKPVLPADKQSAVDAILAAIKQATAAAEDKNVVDLDVVAKVRTMASDIEQAANPGAAPADASQPEDEF